MVGETGDPRFEALDRDDARDDADPGARALEQAREQRERAGRVAARDRRLARGEADVALRMRQPIQPDLIARKLLTVHYHIYASTDYLKRFGTPSSLPELDKHRLITYGEEAPPPLSDVNWMMSMGMPQTAVRQAQFKVNNIYAIMAAARSGLGVAALPDYIAEGKSGLVRILPEVEGPRFDSYFVYPEELRHSKRIAVFRDFLLHKGAEWHF